MIARMGVKLLFVAALGVAALHLAGLTAKVPPRTAAPVVKARTGSSAPTPAASPAAAPPPPVAAPPAEQPFVVRRILKLDKPLRHGDYVWDESGAPAGPIVITVDIGAETISIFRAGYEIGAAAVVYGADSHPTPLGTFPIMQKDRTHISNLYDAPMPYMLRLTNDGVAIHGSPVAWDHATHGCIGVPNKFAALLFAKTRLGDRVIITNGKMIGLGDAIVAG